MKITQNRPYPYAPTTAIEMGGIQRKSKPQLTPQWFVDEDGTLTSRWEVR